MTDLGGSGGGHGTPPKLKKKKKNSTVIFFFFFYWSPHFSSAQNRPPSIKSSGSVPDEGHYNVTHYDFKGGKHLN